MTFSGAVLSSKTPVGYIDLRVFAHATEDPERVLTAVRNVLPSESVDSILFKRSSLAGHHGNPIVLFEARVKDRRLVQAVFAKLCSGLGLMDKEVLAGEISGHLERGNLYLRLDKQSAFLGEVRLGSVDPVHVRVHFKKHGTDEVVSVCREFGLLP
jgi:RNA binding exosome subunit